MRSPRDFLKPLAIGAPDPVREIPFKPSRMIHFLDFSNEKMVAKVPDIAPTVDILLGNLEDAVPVDKKIPAREGLLKVGREIELGDRGELDPPLADDRAHARERNAPVLRLLLVREHAQAGVARVLHEHAMIR